MLSEPGTAESVLFPPASMARPRDPGAGAASGGLTPWQLRRVTSYIEINLPLPMTTGELAAIAKISASHFCRSFARSVGETPHAYVLGRRIERARSLMLASGEPLSQIALACGFADQSHLSRTFRQFVGSPPHKWRREHDPVADDDVAASRAGGRRTTICGWLWRTRCEMQLPLVSLFLGTLALGTTEFLIAGLLPSVAGDLGVSIPTAGFAITAYALGVAIGGPALATALSRVSRKAALVLLLAIFTLGQAACALAPSYEWLVAARVIVAACHGAFFGIAAIVATRLVPPDRAGRAVALLLAGITVANVLGVPAGTAIGGMLGWRTAFWCVLALGSVALLAIALWVPHIANESSTGNDLARQVRVLGRPAVYLTFAAIVFGMIGQLALFTYIIPYLDTVTGIAGDVAPWLLLLYGVGSTIGVIVGGRLADWRLMPSLLLILCAQAATYIVIAKAGGSEPFMVGFIVVWGFVAFAFTAPAQARILRSTRDAPALASALIPTAFNIGIALGAAGGALALQSGWSYAMLPWIGVGASSVAAIIVLWSWRMEQATSRAAALMGET